MKTTHKTLTAAAALAVFLTALPAVSQAGTAIQVDARVQINPRPIDDLQVWIWPDRGEGAEYFPGDPISFNVEVTRDCFLILYDIDTRGNLRILFPYDPWDDNFVAAGDIVRFPRAWDGYDWTVDGPPGIEYVQAIASEFPVNPPDWPVYVRSVNHGGAVCHDPELRDFRAGNDHLDYMRIVNRKITGRFWDWCATDVASFYVSQRYRPVYHPYDPWPDIFYGDIYIGWPIGGRIYVDGVFIGIAPLWIPRHVHYGTHVIICRDHDRIVRRQTITYHAKRDFRHDGPRYKDGRVRDYGQVKIAKPGGRERFREEVRVRDNDRVTRAPRKDVPDRVRTRDESPKAERRKVETREDAGKSRTRIETRGDVSTTRTKIEIKRKSSKSSSTSSVTRSKTVTETARPVSTAGKSEVTKKKSGGLGGLISSVAKSVSKAPSKGETKSASKSSASVKSKDSKAKTASSEAKKAKASENKSGKSAGKR